MSDTEERVQRAARKLRTYFAKGTLSKIENFDGAEHIARAILEAADAPETQKVVVTDEMCEAGLALCRERFIGPVNSLDMEYIYTAMRALEPEPVVTQEVAMAMYTAYENTLGRLDHIPCAQAVLSAAHRVLRGK